MSDKDFLEGSLNFDDLSILELEYEDYEKKMKTIINTLISVIIYYLFSIEDVGKLKEEMSKIMKVINLYKQTLILGNKKIDRIIIDDIPLIKIRGSDNTKFEFITALKKPSEDDINNIINLNTLYNQLRNDETINIHVRSLFKLLSNLGLIITTVGTDEHTELVNILTNIYNRVNELSSKSDGKRRSKRRRSNRKRSNRKRSNRKRN